MPTDEELRAIARKSAEDFKVLIKKITKEIHGIKKISTSLHAYTLCIILKIVNSKSFIQKVG